MKAALISIGIFILLGTAGSADLNNIGITQIIAQLFIGTVLIAVGTVCSLKTKEK